MNHEGKILALSDAHLIPYTSSDALRFQKGMDLVKEADVVILDGDTVEIKHAKDVWESRWGEFLHALSLKSIALGGNHDKLKQLKKIQPFWMKLKKIHRFTNGGTRFVVTHGDRFDSAAHWDKALRWNVVDRWYQTFKSLEERLTLPGNKNLLTLFYLSWNKEQKRRLSEIARPNERVVVGHTHMAEVDVAKLYVNLGSFNRTRPSWAWIENGNISFHIYGNKYPQTIYKDQPMRMID